jgi:hypothetical protein
MYRGRFPRISSTFIGNKNLPLSAFLSLKTHLSLRSMCILALARRVAS